MPYSVTISGMSDTSLNLRINNGGVISLIHQELPADYSETGRYTPSIIALMNEGHPNLAGMPIDALTATGVFNTEAEGLLEAAQAQTLRYISHWRDSMEDTSFVVSALGYTFDASQSALLRVAKSIAGLTATGGTTQIWTTADNQDIEFTLDELKIIHTEIETKIWLVGSALHQTQRTAKKFIKSLPLEDLRIFNMPEISGKDFANNIMACETPEDFENYIIDILNIELVSG